MSDARRYRLRHDHQEMDVTGPAFVIGRDPTCQLVLKQDLVSRRHARVIEHEDGLVIEDLESMNGVFVNERRIREPTLLAHGDTIAIGTETLEVVDTQLLPRAQRPTRPQPIVFPRDIEGPEPVTVTTRLELLTDREREVFELIVLGHTQREIGDRLHISVKTIETYRGRVATKLGCRTRAELVAYAINAGVLRRG
ncbi:MAG TPA: FHA domain-containing protein [Kofleriaceae bacterium]|nr:FHA domain-containing protein [Kofleriaceae bacterium]